MIARDESARRGPLDGIRVLDLSRFISGPFCTQLLANLGADVVKLEKAGRGDEGRDVTPTVGNQSLYFMAMNTNKRSVEVDFRSDKGRQLVLDLAEVADVFVENFRAGTLEKMGLSPELLLERNPRLVITRISGFGQDGPLSQKPVFDAIAQAESGLMSITGRPDGAPMPSGTFIVDYATGLQAGVATLAAVLDARQTGAGQVVDVSLLDSAFAMLMTGPLEKLLLDQEMTRIGNDDRYGSPGGTFPATDGWVHFVAGNPVHFARLLSAMSIPELADDPRFASVALRMENRADIDEYVRAWTSDRSVSDLLTAFEEAGIPAGKVATISQALENPQILFRDDLVRVQHSELGEVPATGVVPKLSKTPGSVRRASPVLGEHSAEVVAEWLTGR